MTPHRYHYRVSTRFVSDAELLRMWRSKLDTCAIADQCGIPEHEVANRLPRIRELYRIEAEWDFDRMTKPAKAGED